MVPELGVAGACSRLRPSLPTGRAPSRRSRRSPVVASDVFPHGALKKQAQ